MRIVAGRWRGRRIRPPDDARVRPTADRVREAWMSIVLPYLVDARVLDLFAGSGALGLEALSRGAASADLVEVSAGGVRTIRENAEQLGAGDELRIHRGDAMRFIEKLEASAYDVAFADPPYGHGLARSVADRWLVVPFAKILGVEHSSKEEMPPGGDTRRFGDTAITFYRA
jgi:16S rRNA (guanine966-N2)-methyltransferase